MSLLERERERERERQREWELNQRELEERRASGDAPEDQGPAWDVNQYGYADDILDLY
jgi:transgelin